MLCHPSPQATLRKPTWSFLARRKSPILAGGGSRGISGHSSAQWPSHFLKGPLGWTFWVPEAQVEAPGPTAQLGHHPLSSIRLPIPFVSSQIALDSGWAGFLSLLCLDFSFVVFLCSKELGASLYRERMPLLRPATDVEILINLSLLGFSFLLEMALSERSMGQAQCLLGKVLRTRCQALGQGEPHVHTLPEPNQLS